MPQPASYSSPHNIPEKILAERINVACIRPYITDRARDHGWEGDSSNLTSMLYLCPLNFNIRLQFTQIQWDFNCHHPCSLISPKSANTLDSPSVQAK